MKKNLVIWGTNEADEKVLIALELKADEGKVMLYTFPEAIVSEEFDNKMMEEWRVGKDLEFPEGYETNERKLSVTESLLPENLKVDRGDLIQRTQTEWHFIVLSSKLHQAYKQELEEIKEKVEKIGSNYDNKLWDDLKQFWDKVQTQSRERNLFREHANNLRDNIDQLFEELKKVRKKLQGEFMAASSVVADEFNKALDEVEERIASGGAKLNTVFEDLKKMQRDYRKARLSNTHRNQIWNRIDKAFKKAKERKFGPEANAGSVVDRHERRMTGLEDAMKRMSDSIARDEEELNFQTKRVDNSDGQLESQIRMAKIKMIEDRLASKRERLEDMKKTMEGIERQINSAKNKEAKRAEKETERKKIAKAKEAIKSEIAAEIKSNAPESDSEDDNKDESAATTIGDVLMDAIDTGKAIASVVADKAEEVFENASEKAKKKASDLADKAEDAMEKAADKAEKFLNIAMDKAEEALDEYNAKKEAAKKSKKDKMDGVNKKKTKMEEVDKLTEDPEEKQQDGIIIEDVVHNQDPGSGDDGGTEAPTEENQTQEDGIIIEDVVHKDDAGMDSGDDSSSNAESDKTDG